MTHRRVPDFSPSTGGEPASAAGAGVGARRDGLAPAGGAAALGGAATGRPAAGPMMVAANSGAVELEGQRDVLTQPEQIPGIEHPRRSQTIAVDEGAVG